MPHITALKKLRSAGVQTSCLQYHICSGSLKKNHTLPTEEISVIHRGGNCLKNVLHLYRMSRKGSIADFLQGGYGSFLKQPRFKPCTNTIY